MHVSQTLSAREARARRLTNSLGYTLRKPRRLKNGPVARYVLVDPFANFIVHGGEWGDTLEGIEAWARATGRLKDGAN